MKLGGDVYDEANASHLSVSGVGWGGVGWVEVDGTKEAFRDMSV